MKINWLKLIILVSIIFIYPTIGLSQNTGPCYNFTSSTGNSYSSISGDVITLYNPDGDPKDEGLSAAISIGFPFFYNFQQIDSFKVCANGFVTLNKDLAWNDELWWPSLSSVQTDRILAPLWSDLLINTSGSIRYEVTGNSPNQILKVEFFDMNFYNNEGGYFGVSLKFQVWLYEGTNVIEFRYGGIQEEMGSWTSQPTRGVRIGINDERNPSFMSIKAGTPPTFSFTEDFEASDYQTDVIPGLIYRFIPVARWQGTDSDEWLTASNWEVGKMPNASLNAQILEGILPYPNISIPGAICDTLYMESGTDLTIAGGGELTVKGELESGGSVTVTSSSETSTGSLIVEGTSDATINFERYVTGDPNWHLVSSPVSGQDIWSWATSGSNNVAMNGSKYGITTYLEENNNWGGYPASDPGGDFIVGKGYSTSRQSNGLVTFTGTINTNDVNDISISYANQGWNLIGNPFTSAIGATSSASSSDYLLNTENVANLSPSYAGLYLWDPASGASGEYVIINNSGGTPTATLGQDYIQAGQGFFVRAKDNSSRTFDITRNMQEHQPAVSMKSGEQWPAIKLLASNGENSSSTSVSFNYNMTRGLDVTYDAGMFKANPDFAIYTRLVEDNGVDFALQCLPEDYSNLVIPVGIDVPTGTEVTFSADLINLPEECDPYLEDRILGAFVALKSGNVYSVTIDDNYKNAQALFLHTSKSTVTTTSVVELSDPFQIHPNYMDGYIRVVSTDKKPALAKVYDTSGRLITIQNVYEGNANIIRFSGKPGIYIVQVNNESHSFNQKIFWKN